MGIQEFVIGIMVKKGIKSAVKLIISAAASVGVVNVLKMLGIQIAIDPIALEGGLTVVINSGLEMLRNFLKQKGIVIL